jgi:prepilin-type processing-associated H-X9-DG protein
MIGLGVMMYANEHKGNFPPDLGAVAGSQDIPASSFVQPGTGKVPPADLTGDALAAWVNENTDYVYVGAGKNFRAGPEEVVAFEKFDETQGAQVNILFADGHVEAVPPEVAKEKVGDAAGGGAAPGDGDAPSDDDAPGGDDIEVPEGDFEPDAQN